MPRKAQYIDDPSILQRLLSAFRGGALPEAAAAAAGVKLNTLLGWIDRDPHLRDQVDEAKAAASSGGHAPSKEAKPDKKGTGAPSEFFARVRAEAEKIAPGLWGILLWLDANISSEARKDPMPAMSKWWRKTIKQFYDKGKRWCILRVGRRGGKSSTLCRVAVVEAIFGDHNVPPGDKGIWPIFSVDMTEARGRFETIKKILQFIGIEFKESENSGRAKIELEDSKGRPIEFRIYPATVSAASGFTGIGGTVDEEAKLKDKDTGANPAKEVLAALRPTLLTQPHAHGYRSSSAFGDFGTHHKAIKRGDSANSYVGRIGEEFFLQAIEGFERVACWEENDNGSETNAKIIREYAATLTPESPNIPSWVANDTLDPVQTRIDCESEDVAETVYDWLRECGSRPSGSAGEPFFDAAKSDEAERRTLPTGQGECFAALDTGSKSNAFALAIVKKVEIYHQDEPIGIVVFPVFLKEWIPEPGEPLDLDRVQIPEAAKICRRFKVDAWITDAYYGTSVELRGAEHQITTTYCSSDPFTEVYDPVRRGINRGTVILSGCENAAEAARQLRLVKSAPADGGRIKIIVPHEGKLHGDLGVALARALAAAGCGDLESYDPTEGLGGIPSRYADEFGSRAA